MIEDYQEIVESFDSQEYYGNVHVLDTQDEGLCAFYYVELKPRFPKKKNVQFAVLWRLLELDDLMSIHGSKVGLRLQESLREEFQYVLDSWDPRIIEKKDISRARKIMLECQSSFPDEAVRKRWGGQRQVGYYLNNKFKGSTFPHDIFSRITKTESGLVVSDEWNDFTLILESQNVYSLFHWSTGA